MSPSASRPRQILTSVGLAACAVLVLSAPSSIADGQRSKVDYVRHLDPSNSATPLIATGVTLSSEAKTYKSSGLGPAGLNTTAPSGTPEVYVDPAQFPGATLPAGVTITEAQGINALRQIQKNLGERGLRLSDVTTMRVFLDNAPGTTKADYNGWNRAYRQFFANTNLDTGKVVKVPLGTATPKRPLVVNSARPSRFALEIASLPVEGWLVEIEVDAVYPR